MKVAKYSTYEMRVRAVQAVKNGQPVSQVAKSYRTNASTIYRWIKKYDETGSEEGLVRKPGSGRPRKLKEIDPDQLKDIILQPASNFGYETDFWTCKRLRDVLTVSIDCPFLLFRMEPNSIPKTERICMFSIYFEKKLSPPREVNTSEVTPILVILAGFRFDFFLERAIDFPHPIG